MIDLLLLVNDLLFVVEFDEFKTSWLLGEKCKIINFIMIKTTNKYVVWTDTIISKAFTYFSCQKVELEP